MTSWQININKLYIRIQLTSTAVSTANLVRKWGNSIEYQTIIDFTSIKAANTANY